MGAEREDGWMTRTEEKKVQQQEAGVEDPASQPVRRGCDPDRNGTDAPDVVGGTVGPARPERSGHSTGAEGFGIPPRHWRRADGVDSPMRGGGGAPGKCEDGGRQRGVGPGRWRLATTTGPV